MEKAILIQAIFNSGQELFFCKSLGCCRKIWNLMLADKIAYYE